MSTATMAAASAAGSISAEDNKCGLLARSMAEAVQPPATLCYSALRSASSAATSTRARLTGKRITSHDDRACARPPPSLLLLLLLLLLVVVAMGTVTCASMHAFIDASATRCAAITSSRVARGCSTFSSREQAETSQIYADERQCERVCRRELTVTQYMEWARWRL
jgi:hypothetical protein